MTVAGEEQGQGDAEAETTGMLGFENQEEADYIDKLREPIQERNSLILKGRRGSP